MKFATISAAVPLLAYSLLSACGSDIEQQRSYSDSTEDEPKTLDATVPIDDRDFPLHTEDFVTPPDEYFRHAFRNFRWDRLGLDADNEPQVLYVDFDGESLRKGFEVGETFIPCTEQITIPPSGIRLSTQQQILDGVSRYFYEQNINVEVVSSRPQEGRYTSIFVGGVVENLNCDRYAGNVLGIAPLDIGNIYPSDIGFVFSSALSRESITFSQLITVAIAHEAGHSFGLQHIDTIDAVMFPTASWNTFGFGRGNIVGPSLSGETFQDSANLLQQTLGEGSFIFDGEDIASPVPEPEETTPPTPEIEPTPAPTTTPTPTPTPTPPPSPTPTPTPAPSSSPDVDLSLPFHNSDYPLDANDDGCVEPVDALTVINALNDRGSGPLPDSRPDGDSFIDVNGDGLLTPIDALQIINYLNANTVDCEA